MIFYSKIKDLDSYKKVINRYITFLIVLELCISFIAMWVSYYEFEKKSKSVGQELLINANSIVQLNISERLGIIVNNQDFVSYLYQGEYSRKLNIVNMMVLFKNFIDNHLIFGIKVKNKTNNSIFTLGNTNSTFYVSLDLCYLNGQINNQFGNCYDEIIIFMSKPAYLAHLSKINSNIQICEKKKYKCDSFDPFTFRKFGSFGVRNATIEPISIKYALPSTYQFFIPAIIIFIISTLGILIINRSVKFLTNKYLAKPIQEIETNLKNNISLKKGYIKEINYLAKEIEEYQEHKFEIELGKNLAQVAHDIRSPLSALTMVTGALIEIPEDKRILIRNATQRINDIANELLQTGKPAQPVDSIAAPSSVNMKSIEFIPALVDILVSEKRMQFREHSALDIQVDLKNSFGSFSETNSKELKRAISNLINNAIEAFDSFNGTVTVGVKKYDRFGGQKVEIFVADNGKGIPAHLISQLCQMGVSHGKSPSEHSGNGLGLYHAKQTAEFCGGTLEIISTEGKGSTVKFILPLAEAPRWFAQKIDLTGKKYLISLDDDTSIHQIWSGRLQALADDPKFNNIEHIKFQSGELFVKYVYANRNKLQETLFLIDFELLNQPKTGLDIIEELGIEKYGILVTSRYEEKNIQDRASRINLCLLPKALAGFVPFEIQKPKLKVDVVVLDNDDLVIMMWKMIAKKNSKSILCFSSHDELFAKLSEIDPSSPFYVDENLGNEVKGEVVTKELFALGFKNLYLATGYPAEWFKHITWVKGVVGKEPVF